MSRHIEYLLLEHDKVIVPALGKFSTQQREAVYIPEEQLFLPPMRSVSLDTEAKEDDGLLKQCLVDLHKISRNTASNWIREFVSDIHETVSDGGVYEIGSIGNLVMDNGKMVFNSCEAGVDTPDYYGLTSLPFAPLPALVNTRKQSDSTHITISLRRSTVRRVASIAAVLVIALMIIVPGYNHITTRGLGNIARVFSIEKVLELVHYAEPQKEVFTQPAPVKHVVTVKPKAVQKPVETLKPSETLEPSETLKPSETQKPSGFVIVLASAIPQKNADEYVRQLQAMGMTNVSAIKDGRMLRVIKSGFDSENEALKTLRELRNSDNELFQQIWLKKL